MTALRLGAALALAAVAARAEEPAAATTATPTSTATLTPTATSNPISTTTSSSNTSTTSTKEAQPAVAMAELPALAGDPAVRIAQGTPAALPPVTAQIFRIGGRLEAQPMFQISIGDPFYRTALLGIRVEQHLDERWSVAVHALGGASMVSAPVDVCTSDSCSGPEAGRLRSAPGNIQMMGGVELGWAPIYGKLSLVGEKTIHFDAYISAGPEFLLERIAPDAASQTSGRWALGGRVSIGERIFFSDSFLLRVAASEVLYGAQVRGHGELERKLSLEAGVAWLFGGR